MSTAAVPDRQPDDQRVRATGRPMRLRAWTRRDVVVLAPRGALDADSLDELDEVLAAGPVRPLVIDLSSCLLVDTSALEQLDPTRWNRRADQVCVVCTRLTGRQLIARAGVTRRMAVFTRAEDALQARILAESGYGPGWGVQAEP